MNRRMGTALVALLGVFVAAYLTLYKLGYIGTLACGTGSCETVQQSPWATFLGLPVAAWGLGYYLLAFALVMASLQERWESSVGLQHALLALTTWGAVFSLWLTYLELYVIHAICRYCVVSACLAVVLWVLSWLNWRDRRHAPPAI
jgi:uncharacterized membrane protein